MENIIFKKLLKEQKISSCELSTLTSYKQSLLDFAEHYATDKRINHYLYIYQKTQIKTHNIANKQIGIKISMRIPHIR